MSLSSAELTTYKRLYSVICKDLVNNNVFSGLGEKGPDGDKGLTGDKGATGDKGLTGDKGATGDTGQPGTQGGNVATVDQIYGSDISITTKNNLSISLIIGTPYFGSSGL